LRRLWQRRYAYVSLMHPRPRILLTLLACFTFAVPAPRADAMVTSQLVYDQLDFPATLRFAPDGRLFFCEVFSGRVMVFHDSLSATPTVWATLPVASGGDWGLEGMTFHPQFPDSPYVYLYHTNPSPFCNRLVRMTDSSGVGTHYCVLFDGIGAGSQTHEGGRLAFGPDHLLYMTVGDQYVPSNAQDTSSTNPLGKILRLTTMGQVAPGNPFGPNNPIAVYGVRNSFGLTFDPNSGEAYFTDNGPTCDDEVNHFVMGANYGWVPDYVCGAPPAGTMLPMWSITPTIAPTGICGYKGTVLRYTGNLFFGCFNETVVRRMVLRPGFPGIADTVETFTDVNDAVLDLTEGPDQRIYIATASAIWRVGEKSQTLGVDPSPQPIAWSLGPSPFTDRVALALNGAASLKRIDIVDVGGRRVRSFAAPISSSLMWDGRDQRGSPVPAGVYLVRAETASGFAVRRIVRLAR
jgi:glucose/arabinose dehydrogenase